MARIGIYAGTFDPVHAGHIAFALQSLKAARLDRVYFLPERRPRAKNHVEHFAHRVAMLRRALKPHADLDIMELVDISFSAERTLPYLKKEFKDDELIFLFGSDVVPRLAGWPKSDRLLKAGELVVGLRSNSDRAQIHKIVEAWPVQPAAVTIFESYAPDVSSGKIRLALRRRQKAQGLLKSVERYSDSHWLYVSLA
jgi:nicotinate-nucleotide adenylyltransferase